MTRRATLRGAERGPLTDTSADVLVCGASFAGLAVARELAGCGADVLLVDRYEIGDRATSACAAPLPWLEAMGLCGHGEAKDLIASGACGPGGRYPVNTGGGQLSAGRLHGFGLIQEACVQLWGEGGERQVEGARLAACGTGGGFIAGTVRSEQ